MSEDPGQRWYSGLDKITPIGSCAWTLDPQLVAIVFGDVGLLRKYVSRGLL